MATHSSILAWEIPWTEEATVHLVTKESDMTLQLNNKNSEHRKQSWGFTADNLRRSVVNGEVVREDITGRGILAKLT